MASANFVVFATLIALTFTEGVAGRTAGGVYRPEVETVPTVVFPPVTPFTAQVTLVLALPVTDFVNCRVASRLTVAVVGVIVTVCAATGSASARIRSGVCFQYFRTITLEMNGTSKTLLETTGKDTYSRPFSPVFKIRLVPKFGYRTDGCQGFSSKR